MCDDVGAVVLLLLLMLFLLLLLLLLACREASDLLAGLAMRKGSNDNTTVLVLPLAPLPLSAVS